MRLIALKNLPNHRRIGTTFDATDAQARILIATGLAKPAPRHVKRKPIQSSDEMSCDSSA